MSHDPHHSDFEQWLRSETDRHRLFADESVWERIRNRVHRRRLYPFVLAALLIISGTVTWVMIDQPDLPINYTSQRTADKNIADLQPLSNDATQLASKPTPYRNIRVNSNRSSLSFLLQSNETQVTQPAIATPTSDLVSTVMERESESPMHEEKRPVAIDLVAEKISARRLKIFSTPTALELSTKADSSQERKEVVQQDMTKSIESSWKPEQYQSIESVINAYHGKRTRKSWKLQLTVSPTISYRKLIENTTALQAARSVMSMAPAIAVPELGNVVNHKPDLGLQVGVSVNRELTERITFVGGLQFNINKYDIRAYRGSQEIATIGLNNGGGTGSVSAYTPYRSSGGVWGNWLANYYFSASAPVGFQFRIVGNKKMNWGVGSTLQPSLVLNNKGYVLSTDYKNYVEVPSLVNTWNLNGQVETFIGFQKGKTRYTVGPQARYQILSSYQKAYPVQEHLFDIGIKLGVGL